MLISYDEALRRILASLAPLTPERARVEACSGRVLAADIVAPIDMPPFDNSAMDGYAVRAADTAKASLKAPARLTVVGEIAAGSDPVALRIAPGQAARIFTGGVVPAGADAIVPVEDTAPDADSGQVAVIFPAEPQSHLRRVGGDMRRGEIALRAGMLLRPYEISQAASLGGGDLPIYRRPRVALIATGNELVEPSAAPLRPGEIYNSNVYALQSLVQEAGGEAVGRLHALDTPDSIRAVLREAASLQPDVVVSSGGVSVGDYDFVKAAVEQDGSGAIDFWRVAIRPGKPFVFGRYQNALFFGLPGNPVSTIVTYELFVRPALRRLAGYALGECPRPILPCVLTAPASHEPGRRSFQRAVAGVDKNGLLAARPVAKQGSHMIGGLVQANSLIIVPEETAVIDEGEQAQVMLLGEVGAYE